MVGITLMVSLFQNIRLEGIASTSDQNSSSEILVRW